MNPMTLGDAAERVAALSANCRDELVPVADLSFEALDTVLISGEARPLKDTAQGAIASRLGIPVNYLAKSPRELQAHNLNFWLTREVNEKLLFRFDGQAVRAVFTPRYVAADNAEVLNRFMDAGIPRDSEVRLRLDERFMHLSIPDEARSFAIRPKDRVTPGLSVGNSEVGLASLSVAAFFLRLVCTNGLVTQAECGARYRHLSRRILDDLPAALSGVGSAIEAGGDRFRISLESKVTDPASTMKSFNKRFLLTPEECDAVSWGWEAEPGDSMFQVINAYTKGAQLPGLNVDSAYRLEKVGGDILSMVRH